MTGPPSKPFQPYAEVHASPGGPGDARPTALQIIADCNMKGQLRGKSILITGASSGIGLTTAKALYTTGARLFLTARDMGKLKEAIEEVTSDSTDAPRPEAIEMHLDSLASVRKAAVTVKSKTMELNILVCNAGIMAAPYSLTEDGLESHMAVNHFAHFLLFQLLQPLLLRGASTSSTTSRVICLSSSAHWYSGIRDDMHFKRLPVTYNKWQAYGQSKTANIYMANAITRRYAAQGITALAAHPGSIATNLTRHLSQEDFDQFGDASDLMNAFKNPEQGAATTVWAALSPHFEDVANGGRYLADCGESGPTKAVAHAADTGYDPHAYDEVGEERLWKLSCETVGV